MPFFRARAAALMVAMAGGLLALDGPALMPLPVKATPGAGELPIDSGFHVTIAGYTDARLQAAANRFLARLARQTGIPFRSSNTAGSAALTVKCEEGGAEYPSLDDDESYQLNVTSRGAVLAAKSVTGALRGMETFLQIAGPGAHGFAAPSMHIEDRPRFPWRGLMIDVARHWMPREVIERNLDAMAAVKLNVLHWHLSDDQGFRVESRRYPRLQQYGSDGAFYTQEEVRGIVEYARARGIRVIPEFDVPGHVTSWVTGYPELASAPGPYAIERTWGIFAPTLDPAREETYAFLDGLFGEMAALFPDPFFHIGGDEVEDGQWKQSPSIQAFVRAHALASSHDLHAYFNRRVEALLRKHGKTLEGWDEVLDPGLSKDAVIQSWRGQESLAAAAKQGHRGILSFGYYLDHLKPAAFHYAVDPLDGAARDLGAAESARILGGEACMWSEYVSPETVDSRLWPRLAAIAERLWSPRNVTNVDSMYARLERVNHLLDSAGLRRGAESTRMLDRIAGGRPSAAVRTLAEAVEALGIEGRRGARKYSSGVPLNRLVDAAAPESETVFELETAAARLSPDDTARLSASFTEWRNNRALLDPLAKENFLVRELLPLAERLSATGAIGLEALDCITEGRNPGPAWAAEQRKRLDEMEQPMAEVRLAAVRPVRILLDAAGGKVAQTRHVRSVTNVR